MIRVKNLTPAVRPPDDIKAGMHPHQTLAKTQGSWLHMPMCTRVPCFVPDHVPYNYWEATCSHGDGSFCEVNGGWSESPSLCAR